MGVPSDVLFPRAGGTRDASAQPTGAAARRLAVPPRAPAAAGDPLAVPTVLRCIKLLADTVTQMRPALVRGDGQAAPLPKWLDEPQAFGNEWRLRDLVEYAVTSMASRGFAAWDAQPAGDSWTIAAVSPRRVGGWLDNRDRRTLTLDGEPVPEAYGPARRGGLLIAGWLQLPDRALPIGPLQAARDSIGGAVDTEQFASRVFRAGNWSGQVLTTDQPIEPARALEWREQWMDFHTDPSDPRIPVLGNGLHLDNALISPRDAQWIEAREFNAREIARLFGVPASLLGLPGGDSLTYATTRDHDAHYLRFGASAYSGSLADAWASLMPPGDDLHFDPGALLKPVAEEEIAAWLPLLQAGAVTVDEFRAKVLRLGPIPAPDPAPAAAPPEEER